MYLNYNLLGYTIQKMRKELYLMGKDFRITLDNDMEKAFDEIKDFYNLKSRAELFRLMVIPFTILSKMKRRKAGISFQFKYFDGKISSSNFLSIFNGLNIPSLINFKIFSV